MRFTRGSQASPAPVEKPYLVEVRDDDLVEVPVPDGRLDKLKNFFVLAGRMILATVLSARVDLPGKLAIMPPAFRR